MPTEPHQTAHRAPWVVMALATAVLAACVLAACRVGSPPGRIAAYPEAGTGRRAASSPPIRVRLQRRTDEILLDAEAPIEATDAAGRPVWSGRGPLRVTRRPASGFVLGASPAGAGPIRFSTGPRGFRVGRGSESIRLIGELAVVATSGSPPGTFDLIETLPIERYLPGVLAKELYHGFHARAFEAQAIAARSYALHERSRRAAMGSDFDVEASTMDQAYGGATAHPAAEDAVARTRGRVLVWNGEILRAYYSSTCGDLAASAADTWPTGEGYSFNLAAPIQATSRRCACSASPRHRWSVERTLWDVSRRIKLWGAAAGNPIKAISTVRSIAIASRNAAGRPNRYRVTDDRGRRYELTAESLRLALNTERPDGPPITMSNRVLSGDFRVVIAGNRVTITGRGFGHGVGLCQFGANGLAGQGLSVNEILARYYPGATIERAYR